MSHTTESLIVNGCTILTEAGRYIGVTGAPSERTDEDFDNAVLFAAAPALLRENAELRSVLNDAANALGEIIQSSENPHFSVLERANRLLDREIFRAARSEA